MKTILVNDVFFSSVQNYDGAFGQDCNQEGHAGLTYCAVAALSLMGTLDRVLSFQQVAKHPYRSSAFM